MKTPREEPPESWHNAAVEAAAARKNNDLGEFVERIVEACWRQQAIDRMFEKVGLRAGETPRGGEPTHPEDFCGRCGQSLRAAMEELAIHAHLARSDSLPDDREPPGAYEYEGKAWWELPEEAKQYYRGLIERGHPTWAAALRASAPGGPHKPFRTFSLQDLRDAVTAHLGGEKWRRVADQAVDAHLQGTTVPHIAAMLRVFEALVVDFPPGGPAPSEQAQMWAHHAYLHAGGDSIARVGAAVSAAYAFQFGPAGGPAR